MQLEAQPFLTLCERAGSLCSFDIEATGLHGDYNCILVISIKPFGKPARIGIAQATGDDSELLKWAVEELEKYDCWLSYYGKGFDVRMMQTRLLANGSKIVMPKKPHIDLYFSVVLSLLKTSRRSQAHLMSWLYPEEKETAKKQQKMTVPAGLWVDVLNPAKQKAALKKLAERCDRDTIGLEGLYKKVRHLIREVNR